MKACELTFHNTNCQKDKRFMSSAGAVIRSCHENLCGMGNNWKENNEPSPGNELFKDYKESLKDLWSFSENVGRNRIGSHLGSKNEWSFLPSQFQVNTETSWTENHTKPPQQRERVNVAVFNCLRPPCFQSPALGSCRTQQSCRMKQRTATFLLPGMQRWRGAARTLPTGRRSGTGHSKAPFWATCAEAVKLASRALHGVSVAVSVSVGGQRAGGAPGPAGPGPSLSHKPVRLPAAASRGQNLTDCFGLHRHGSSVSIKASGPSL